MNRVIYALVIAGIVTFSLYRTLPWMVVLDRVMLVCACALFLFFLLGDNLGAKTEEAFTTDDTDTSNSTEVSTFIHKENLDVVRDVADDKLVLYATLFHPDSTRSLPATWKSVSSVSDTQEFELDQDGSTYSSTDKSLTIDSNFDMKGPGCNTIAITNKKIFSIIMVMRNHAMSNWNYETNTEAPLLQLFCEHQGNTEANNWLKMSFTNQNGITPSMGDNQYNNVTMKIEYSDKNVISDPFVVSTSKTYMYIVTVTDSPELLVSLKRIEIDSNRTDQSEIVMTGDLKDSAVLTDKLSRKMLINGGEVGMMLYNIAIFDTTLDTNEITNLANHLKNNFNPVNTRCPYNDEICFSEACIEIDDWADHTQLINRPDCRKKVHDVCVENDSVTGCGNCWNPNTPDYDTPKCRLWRSYMKNEEDLAGFSSTQLDTIRQTYSLVSESDKTSAVNEAISNERAAADRNLQSEKDKCDKSKSEAVDKETKRLTNYYENPDRLPKATSGLNNPYENDSSRTTKTMNNPYNGSDESGDTSGDTDLLENPYEKKSSSSRIPSFKRVKSVGDDSDDVESDSGGGLLGWIQGLFS